MFGFEHLISRNFDLLIIFLKEIKWQNGTKQQNWKNKILPFNGNTNHEISIDITDSLTEKGDYMFKSDSCIWQTLVHFTINNCHFKNWLKEALATIRGQKTKKTRNPWPPFPQLHRNSLIHQNQSLGGSRNVAKHKASSPQVPTIRSDHQRKGLVHARRR